MNADTELNSLLRRQAGVTLDHAVLALDRAANGVDDAAKLDENAVAGSLDYAAVMQSDGRINQVAAKRPKPRQGAVLVRAGETRKADHVGGKDRGELAGLNHCAPQVPSQHANSIKTPSAMLFPLSKGQKP